MEQMLNQLKEAIISADSNQVDILMEAMDGQVDGSILYEKCIQTALDTLCANIRLRKGAVPELLMGLKQVDRIAEKIQVGKVRSTGERLIIGVVEGDIHDMGKNVIRDVCRGYGHEVLDLGKNVPSGDFASAARDNNADVACLSTMMSTTVPAMKETVERLKSAKPDIRILIGGAFMNSEFAEQFGASGYAEDASMIISEIKRVMQ